MGRNPQKITVLPKWQRDNQYPALGVKPVVDVSMSVSNKTVMLLTALAILALSFVIVVTYSPKDTDNDGALDDINTHTLLRTGSGNGIRNTPRIESDKQPNMDKDGAGVTRNNELSVSWKKPSSGVPSQVVQFVLAVECKQGSTIYVPFHYILTDPGSTVAPVTSTAVTRRAPASDLGGATCKANIFGYNAAGTNIWYAVQNSNLDTVGTLGYTYNGTRKSNVGVAQNGYGGGDFVWTIP